MKILRVNMRAKTGDFQEVPEKYRLLSGRGLIAHLMLDEVPPTCHPLGRHNKLIITSGLLCPFAVPSAGRISVGGKSPLTGGIKEANSGGTAAQRLARLGIRAIVVEDKPEDQSLYVLKISRAGAELVRDDSLRGLGNYELADILRQKHGSDQSIISVGPAGERMFGAAGVFITDTNGVPGRAAARGGLGAVMGSKGLKAIVISNDGTQRPNPAKPEEFRKALKAFADALRNNPQTAEVYPKYGTIAALQAINKLGGLPTRNFSSGSFENPDALDADRMRDLILKRGGEGKTTESCMPGCIIECSNVFPDENGKAIVAPLEYESIAMLGPNLGVEDFDTIARLNRLCNDYGLDTVEAGVALGVAAEAGLMKFGDGEKAISLLEEVGQGTILGRVLGQGAATAGKVLGVLRVPAVKGQAIPAHEPRGIKGMSVTYTKSPMGADHTAGVTFRGPLDHHKADGQVAFSRGVQITNAAHDTIGFCIFVTPVTGKAPKFVVDLLRSAYGESFPEDFLDKLGRDVLKTEREFNQRAGLGDASEIMPEFMTEEPLPPFGVVSDIPEEDLKKFWEEV